MRKLKSIIGLAALLVLPAIGSAPASAADLCPPAAAIPTYCPYAQTPTVVTGPTTVVTRTTATVSGTINPHGASVYYAFQYGLTTNYTALTTIHHLSATTSTVGVTLTISGLTPGTLFHYRLIAINNALQSGAGVDRTFTTLTTGGSQILKLRTSLTIKAKPKRDKTLPFKYKFSGRVKVPAGTDKAAGCGGKVAIKLKHGTTTVATGSAKVSKKCTYKKTIKIASTTKTGAGAGKLKVTGKYGGDSSLRTSKKTTTVKFF